MDKQAIKIVCFGDSLTYGYGVLETDGFCHLLSENLKEKFMQISFDVINSGINGHTTREALSRLQGSVLQRKPQIVTILFGSNDSALQEGNYRTPIEYEQNMVTIIERILSLSGTHTFAGGKTIPILLTPPSMVDTDFYPYTTNDRLQAYGNIIKRLAETYHLPCIDLFSILQSIANPQTYADCFQYDGLHLSKKGYAFLYPHLEKTILSILQQHGMTP